MIVVSLALVAAASSQAASGAYDNYLAPARVCPGNDVPTLLASEQTTAMLCLIDFARATRGVGALARSPLLDSSASIKADDILRCNEFSHTACGRPASATFEQTGYVSPDVTWDVGENLAFGSDLLGSPRAIMRDWLESDEHRQNLFSGQWRDQGLALRKPAALLGLTTRTVWVSHFGRRDSLGQGEGGSSDVPASALRLSVRPARATVGRRTRFRFVLTSAAADPVPQATVSFASRRARTDAQGRATITARLRRPGRYRAVASQGPLQVTKSVRVARR